MEQPSFCQASPHFQTEDNAWYPDSSQFHSPLALRRPQNPLPHPIIPGCIPISTSLDPFYPTCPVPLTPPWDQSGMYSDNVVIKPRDIVTCRWPAGPLVDSAYSSPSGFQDPTPIKKSMVQRYLESLPEETDDSTETPQMGPTHIPSGPTEMMLDLPYRDFQSIFDPEMGMRPQTPFTPTGTPRPLTEAALSNFGVSELSLSCASFSSLSRASTPALSRSLSRSSYRIPRRRSSKSRKHVQDEPENSDCPTPSSFISTSTVGCSRTSSVRKPAATQAKEAKTRLRIGRSRSKKAYREPEPVLLHPIPIRGAADLSGTDIGSSEEDSCFSEAELSAFEYRDDAPGMKECIQTLFNSFRDWQRQRGSKRTYGQANAPPIGSGFQSSSSSNSSQHSFFQGLGPSHDDLGGENNDGAETQQASKKRKSLSHPSRTFACPFWKKDARKHRACGKLTLTRVKDVKQHLNRSRAHKPHYCSCCYETFPTREALDEHSRARSCPLRSPRPVEGLTEQQSRALQRRVDRRLSDEEQWYCMWDIIHPNDPRPLTPYIDHDLSEDLAEFREFTTSSIAADIFQDYLASHGYQFTAPSAGRERTNTIISGGFDLVYNRWLEAGRETGGASMQRSVSNGLLISPPDSNSSQESPEATRRVGSEPEPETETQRTPSGPIIPGLLDGVPMSPLPGNGYDSFEEFLQFDPVENFPHS